MSFADRKVTYVDEETFIFAENMNDIQDAIISTTSYVVCTTSASTKAKTVSLNGFMLETGATVRVKFNDACRTPLLHLCSPDSLSSFPPREGSSCGCNGFSWFFS